MNVIELFNKELYNNRVTLFCCFQEGISLKINFLIDFYSWLFFFWNTKKFVQLTVYLKGNVFGANQYVKYQLISNQYVISRC